LRTYVQSTNMTESTQKSVNLLGRLEKVLFTK